MAIVVLVLIIIGIVIAIGMGYEGVFFKIKHKFPLPEGLRRNDSFLFESLPMLKAIEREIIELEEAKKVK